MAWRKTALSYLFPITPLEGSVPIRWAGYTLCVASLIWVCIAQVQMGVPGGSPSTSSIARRS